jgi:hypothetical protein
MKKLIVVAIIGAALAVVFGSGLLSVSDVEGWFRHIFYRGRGGVANALQGEKLGNLEEANKCRENLRLLESAKRKVASEKGIAVGVVTWPEVLKAAGLREKPVCPSGGEYRLNELGRMVTCTISGNETVDTADDHIIHNY